MSWHFGVVISSTLFLYYYTQLIRVICKNIYAPTPKANEPMPEPFKVKLFGGPLNGKEERVPELKSFFIAPYMPENPEDQNVVGEGPPGFTMVMPNFAFYQQVGEPEVYFYRRDITITELESMQQGDMPDDLKGA